MIRGGSRRQPAEASLGSENSLAVYESAEESLTLESVASGSLPTPRDGGMATPPLASPQGSLKAAMPAAELALQDTARSPEKSSRTGFVGGGEVAGAAGAVATAAAANADPPAETEPPTAEQPAAFTSSAMAPLVGSPGPAVSSDSSSAGHFEQAFPDSRGALVFSDAGQQEQNTLQVQQQQPLQQQTGHREAAVNTALPTSNGSSTANGTPTTTAAASTAAASSSGRSTGGAAGSSMVSVPMSNAPDTGIFSIPEEAFRIRDLDTGKEYALDKRYWVKNLDTGTVYVLESEQGGGAGAEPSKVTELLSGRELSINQFEGVLGYFREPHKAPGPQERMQLAEQQGLTAQQLAQKSLKSINAGASWVKQSMSSAMQKVKQGGSPRAGAGDEFGAAAAGADAAAAAAGGLDERQGVPVKVYRKSFKEFTDLRLVQRLTGHQGVVWTMKFSRNGKYLASAGQDCTIQVWEVVPNRTVGSRAATPTALDRQAAGSSSGAAAAPPDGGSSSSSGRVFAVQPYRVYSGHKQDVLDLCWSKTQFLLSASMDKTVRLWHITMDECLRVFKHTDFVTAIDFHPSDDKMFLSGSIDGKVRLWNIPEQRVVSWQDVHEMVTAVSYAPVGRKAVVGTMKGKCRFYSIQNNALEYEAQLDVKNKRGQHARGKKITGLQFLPMEPGKLLITSNDSRIRLYDGYTLRCKYKGHSNRNTQIRASLSPQGDFITCGSDDGWVYIWATRKSSVPAGASPPPSPDANPFAKEKNAAYECFQANGDIVTVAVFAPESTHRQLDASPAAAAAAAPVARAADAAGGSRQPLSGSLGDRSEGEAALAAARARGQVIITAGYSGEVKVYENSGLPQWL